MRKHRLNKRKFFRFIGITIITVLIIWFAASYVEIVAKNLNENVSLCWWNIWNLGK